MELRVTTIVRQAKNKANLIKLKRVLIEAVILPSSSSLAEGLADGQGELPHHSIELLSQVFRLTSTASTDPDEGQLQSDPRAHDRRRLWSLDLRRQLLVGDTRVGAQVWVDCFLSSYPNWTHNIPRECNKQGANNTTRQTSTSIFRVRTPGPPGQARSRI
ncbi:hypothetical protein GE09DRAFT_1110577 [Coniochaeta sp. 2T2.1]|nr:hypothetical protein GE09DRAFT_1110577 [Coniochaeta sp. 2T2.1]